MTYSKIPAAMRAAKQWLVWKSISDADTSVKPRKVPFYVSGVPRHGAMDSPEDQARFGTFDEAVVEMSTGQYAGLGFALINGWQGVDLDKMSERWELDAYATVLSAITYCERSPNKDGIHAIGFGEPFQAIGSADDGIEAYSSGRFFTVTGDAISELPPSDISFYVESVLRPARGETVRLERTPIQYEERTDFDIAELRDALTHIPPDDRDTWINAGQALCKLGDVGFELWMEWSARSDKHHPRRDARTWQSFRGDHTGVARIFTLAEEHGWVNPKRRKPLDTSAIGFGRGVVSASHAMPEARVIQGSRLIFPEQQMQLFSGCVYVASENKILTPGGWLLDRQRFDNMIGGFSFIMNNDNAGAPSKSAWEAFLLNQAFDSPRVDTLCFRPELPAAAIIREGGQRMVNIWWPVETDRIEGDVTPFLLHLSKLLPNETDRAQLIAYMAAMVKYPGVKFQWCPVIQGCEGNGKSFLSACIEYAIGDRYTHKPNASEIGSKFNGWLRGKLFVSVEEVMTDHKRETLDALKPLITNSRVEIQGKGVDQTTGDNRANFLMFTNHKNAIPVDVDKRRYAIYYTAQQSAEHIVRDGMGNGYFPALYKWARAGGYAHMAHYLSNYDVPEELNPATTCHRAPTTSSTAEAIFASLGSVEHDILECVESGEMGFKGGWISTTMLSRRFANTRVTSMRLATALTALGYIKHPGLPGGRCDNAVPVPDGNKPRLYVKPDHPSVVLLTHKDIAAAYSAAQVNFG